MDDERIISMLKDVLDNSTEESNSELENDHCSDHISSSVILSGLALEQRSGPSLITLNLFLAHDRTWVPSHNEKGPYSITLVRCRFADSNDIENSKAYRFPHDVFVRR
ncbi:jg21232 [Pararge aegeria aegeria]|uniref:Jg21232 protein n=1 Tax=Pararge aegeria aegeria TaxID=348720 RepID=A0A8S4R8F5_9NEOP|nr:jg21232 [Pararge aegeria aegeria]